MNSMSASTRQIATYTQQSVENDADATQLESRLKVIIS